MKPYENFIEGEFIRDSNEGQTIPVFNPATEEEIAQVRESSDAEINRAIDAATRAQKKWAKLAAVERGKYLREIAARIRDRTDFLSVDYGPPINQEGLSKVEGMVSRATGEGATVVTGGRRADLGKGWFYEPTVLADCRQKMEIVQKEIFGPASDEIVWQGSSCEGDMDGLSSRMSVLRADRRIC